jgi:hypothetical protein
MIMIGVKDVQCAEHIGRIVHISLYLNNTPIYRIKDYNGEEINCAVIHIFQPTRL